MKKVTAVLLVYAILVVASSIFWVWSAMAKSRPTAGSSDDYINLATDPDKMKLNAEMVTGKATELTGGVTDDVRQTVRQMTL